MSEASQMITKEAKEQLLSLMIDEMKEAQLKLGYAKEVIRLYIPMQSLCAILQIPPCDANQLSTMLQSEFSAELCVLGQIVFTACKGERIEVRIPAEGATYVHEQVENPPFLSRLIELFQQNHHLSIEEICACFAQFSPDYVCEKMPEGTDFDYALYFPNKKPDAWYYCIHSEMNHTIYHRFSEPDYLALMGESTEH